MKGSIAYRYRSITLVERSLDRKRSLELTRSGDDYCYRQASIITPSMSAVSNRVQCYIRKISLRPACYENFISQWHYYLCKQFRIYSTINRIRYKFKSLHKTGNIINRLAKYFYQRLFFYSERNEKLICGILGYAKTFQCHIKFLQLYDSFSSLLKFICYCSNFSFFFITVYIALNKSFNFFNNGYYEM